MNRLHLFHIVVIVLLGCVVTSCRRNSRQKSRIEGFDDLRLGVLATRSTRLSGLIRKNSLLHFRGPIAMYEECEMKVHTVYYQADASDFGRSEKGVSWYEVMLNPDLTNSNEVIRFFANNELYLKGCHMVSNDVQEVVSLLGVKYNDLQMACFDVDDCERPRSHICEEVGYDCKDMRVLMRVIDPNYRSRMIEVVVGFGRGRSWGDAWIIAWDEDVYQNAMRKSGKRLIDKL